MLGSLHAGLGFAPAATFAPTDIAGCKLWLRGDLGVTTSGGNVIAIADQSGNGNNVVNSGTVAFNASAIGGLPGWTGDGNAWLENTTSNLVSAGSGRTVFVVAKAAGATGGGLLEFRTSIPTNVMAHVVAGTGLLFYDSAHTWSDGADASTSPIVYEGAWSSAVAPVLKANGSVVTFASGSGNLDADSGDNGFRVMSWNRKQPSVGWAGDMTEVVVYDSILSSPNAAMLRSYLGARHGITVI
jgi:hypothetical protein